MNFFDDPANVEQYISLSKGYDGSFLVNNLTPRLTSGATVLELGMGEGKDLALLSKHYQVTGSDASPIFVQRYLANNPQADVLQLDALSIATERQFNGIYSNKVLHQLSRDQLAASFQQQYARLLDNGLTIHSYWLGDGTDVFAGDKTYYYRPDVIAKLMAPYFSVLHVETYAEADKDDSFFIISQSIKS